VLRTLKTMAALETGGFSRAVWGPTIKDASKFWLVIGWQSVEVRNSDKANHMSLNDPFYRLTMTLSVKKNLERLSKPLDV